VPRAGADDLADRPVGDAPLDLDDLGPELRVLRDLEDDVGRSGRGQDALGGLDGVGDRLLEEQVPAGTEHRQGDLLVQVVGDHHQRGVERVGGDGLVQGGEHRGAGPGGQRLGPVPIGVDARGHRRALTAPIDGVVVPPRDRTAPDQPHA
jgi:hypothetical protein